MSGKNNPMYGLLGENNPNWKEKRYSIHKDNKGNFSIFNLDTKKNIIYRKDEKIINNICNLLNNNKITEYEAKKYTQRSINSNNTSGYYRVCKKKDKKIKQGFRWIYSYVENGKSKQISSIDIKKLEQKVKEKKLKWKKV